MVGGGMNMTTKNLEAKLKKDGFDVQELSAWSGRATQGAAVVEWHNQDGEAITIRVRRSSDADDAVTGYGAGGWVKTYPQVQRCVASYNH